MSTPAPRDRRIGRRERACRSRPRADARETARDGVDRVARADRGCAPPAPRSRAPSSSGAAGARGLGAPVWLRAQETRGRASTARDVARWWGRSLDRRGHPVDRHPARLTRIPHADEIGQAFLDDRLRRSRGAGRRHPVGVDSRQFTARSRARRPDRSRHRSAPLARRDDVDRGARSTTIP